MNGVGEGSIVDPVHVRGEGFGIQDGVDPAVRGLVLRTPVVAGGPVGKEKFEVGVAG